VRLKNFVSSSQPRRCQRGFHRRAAASVIRLGAVGGKWIFIAGRTGGYHGIGQGDVDFAFEGESKDLGDRSRIRFQPRSTVLRSRIFPLLSTRSRISGCRAICCTIRTTNVVSGGRIRQNSAGETVTYPVLSCVNLQALVDGVTQGKDTFSKTISYVESPLVQSTGAPLSNWTTGSSTWSAATFSWARIERSKRPVKRIRKRFRRRIWPKFEAAGSPRRRQARSDDGRTIPDPEFARRDLNART